MSTPIRVVVGEDDLLLREGVVRLLTEEGFEVVGQAGDATELTALVREKIPDLVVIDIRMPPTHTEEQATRLEDRRSEPADCPWNIAWPPEQADRLRFRRQPPKHAQAIYRTAFAASPNIDSPAVPLAFWVVDRCSRIRHLGGVVAAMDD